MLEMLSAKDILKINVDFLKNKGFTLKSQEINNIYQIISTTRNDIISCIEYWKIDSEYNNVKLDKNGKGYFLLEYDIFLKHECNLSNLDINTYYKAIIKEFEEVKTNSLSKK